MKRRPILALCFAVLCVQAFLARGLFATSAEPSPTAQPSAPTPGPSPIVTTIPVFTPLSIPGSGSQTFPETGKAVSGLFLDYWNAHGGLAQQGLPISDLM